MSSRLQRTARPDLIYLAWGRLQRPRANLIQTLHTVAAMAAEGIAVRLYLPPWPKGLDVDATLWDLGVSPALDLRGAFFLHRRWGGVPFVLLRHAALRTSRAVYTRVPRLSLALARAGIRHHLEVHDVRGLERQGVLGPLADLHRAGRIGLLVPISQAGAAGLLERGLDRARIHVAPSGVDVDTFARVPALDPARLARPRVIYLGRISRDRGLGVFEALASGGVCDVTLVGPVEDPPSVALEIHPPVRHREVPDWYARAEIALMPYQPSLSHAPSISPIKLFEAMAAGRPVVVSDLPALRELVTDGETGLLVPPADPRAWVAAVERLRHDPGLALHLAQGGRRVANEHTWRTRARGILGALGLSVA